MQKWLSCGALWVLAMTMAQAQTAVGPALYRGSGNAGKAAAAGLLLDASAPRQRVQLAPPTEREAASLSQKDSATNVSKSGDKGRPLPIGYVRMIPPEQAMNMSALPWQATADGGLAARMDIESPGAAAIRLGLVVRHAPPALLARFTGSAASGQVFGPIAATEMRRAETYWSPVLEGDTATVEFYLPPGVSSSDLDIELPEISHLIVAGSALRTFKPKASDPNIGTSGPCEIDVKCVANPSAALSAQATSVARMIFTDAGTSFLCTGTVLNDLANSFIPYFWAASHCMDSQAVADTLNTYWFFDAVSCGNRADPNYTLVAGGAKLLAHSVDYDWALLRLNNPPPAGVHFSAWRAEAVPQGATASTLHHPSGDLEKFSQGTTQGYFTFSDGSSFVNVIWSQGSTEGGSSGAGLFTFSPDGSFYELRGGLFAGDAACNNPSGHDYFSRMDVALPLLRDYLTPGAANPAKVVPVVEFYNATLKHYFISSNTGEIDDLDRGVHVGWVRTGLRFLAYSDPRVAPADAQPVCRFYEKPEVGDSHFYSADPQECARVAAQFAATWVFESPNVFYIQLPDRSTGQCPTGTHPVYRFFDAKVTNHRFTTEVDVRRDLTAAGLTQEGYGNPPNQVAMCAPASQ